MKKYFLLKVFLTLLYVLTITFLHDKKNNDLRNMSHLLLIWRCFLNLGCAQRHSEVRQGVQPLRGLRRSRRPRGRKILLAEAARFHQTQRRLFGGKN